MRLLFNDVYLFASLYTLNYVTNFQCTVIILFIFSYFYQRAKQLLLFLY